jgi:hypothetical protein
MRARDLLADHWPELVAMCFGAGWFFYLGYGPTLDPRSIGWMMREDWSFFFWGWSFFRRADWAFPLGSLPNLSYPLGTSVAFCDANPWLSLLFKPLSRFLPLDFQFFGIWFLACYMLQALVGAKITETMTSDRLQRALGGALFATSPVLPIRAYHVSLSAIFFVTAGVWLNLVCSDDAQKARRYAIYSFVLLAWVTGTHGYLAAMLLALCVAYYARIAIVQRSISLLEGFAFLGVALLSVLGTSYLFGLIGWRKAVLTTAGFGEFSADTLALINSQGLSRFVPGLPFRPSQWEGFQYLGLGVLSLLSVGAGQILRRPLRLLRVFKAQWPLLLVTFAMCVYSWSSIVTYKGEQVLDLSEFYEYLWPAPGILRSSGRLGWPLHMVLFGAAVASAVYLKRRWHARALLVLALVLEGAEHDPNRLSFDTVPLRPLTGEVWGGLAHDYAHLALVPVQIKWDCPYNEPLVNALSYVAYRQNLTFNSGNFMGKGPDVHRLCGQSVRTIDPRTVYVVEPSQIPGLRARGAVCGTVDGFWVCVASGRPTALAGVLKRSAIP